MSITPSIQPVLYITDHGYQANLSILSERNTEQLHLRCFSLDLCSLPNATWEKVTICALTLIQHKLKDSSCLQETTYLRISKEELAVRINNTITIYLLNPDEKKQVTNIFKHVDAERNFPELLETEFWRQEKVIEGSTAFFPYPHKNRCIIS